MTNCRSAHRCRDCRSFRRALRNSPAPSARRLSARSGTPSRRRPPDTGDRRPDRRLDPDSQADPWTGCRCCRPPDRRPPVGLSCPWTRRWPLCHRFPSAAGSRAALRAAGGPGWFDLRQDIKGCRRPRIPHHWRDRCRCSRRRCPLYSRGCNPRGWRRQWSWQRPDRRLRTAPAAGWDRPTSPDHSDLPGPGWEIE